MEPVARYVEAELTRLADPDAAVSMAAYMKTDMPFYGVRAPERRLIARAAKAAHPPADAEEYRRQVLALWRLPHREEKYLAIAVARSHSRFVTVDHLDLYQRMIEEGAWWDLVDEIAIDLVGRVLRTDPSAVVPVLRQWIDSTDMWLRRAAIICQNKSRDGTDLDLLRSFTEKTAHEKEFFIRKAIGWALREQARTNPDAVRRILDEMGDRLSGLSRREASKHL